MHYLPIELDVRARRVVLLGGSPLLAPKLDRLLAAEAVVALYACGVALAPELATLCEVAGVAVEPGEPSEADLETAVAVFASPDLGDALARWHLWARRSGRLLSAIDRPGHSTFASPAAGEASGIGVRFFSAGVSPGLVMRLRDDVVAALSDERFARFVKKLAELRASLPPPGEGRRRSDVMRDAIDGFAVDLALRFPKWLG